MSKTELPVAKTLGVLWNAHEEASEKAYAAVVYARYEFDDGSIGTALITAKSRLASLKALSIPRLELMRAIIGLRLTKQVY